MASASGSPLVCREVIMSTHVSEAEQRYRDAVYALLDGRGTAEQVEHAFRRAPTSTRRLDTIIQNDAAMARLLSLKKFPSVSTLSFVNMRGAHRQSLPFVQQV